MKKKIIYRVIAGILFAIPHCVACASGAAEMETLKSESDKEHARMSLEPLTNTKNCLEQLGCLELTEKIVVTPRNNTDFDVRSLFAEEICKALNNWIKQRNGDIQISGDFTRDVFHFGMVTWNFLTGQLETNGIERLESRATKILDGLSVKTKSANKR